MKSKFLTALALFSLLGMPMAISAVKPKVVKMVNPVPLVEKTFFQGAGGQWFSTLLTAHSLYLVGTSEPSSAPTQGEVIAISPIDGSKQWDLPLPTTTDAIATAATLDSAGNIWVAGSTAPAPMSATPTPTPTPTNALNPSGVSVDPVPPVRPGLTQITLWEVGSTGSLLNTYSYDAGFVVEPLTVSFAKNLFTIGGRDFHVTASLTGKFSKFVQASFVQPKSTSTATFKDGLYIWKSFISKAPIAGVTGWKPKVPTPVILKVGGRTGTIYSAYKISDPIMKIDYLSKLGVVVTTESANGYAVLLLK